MSYEDKRTKIHELLLAYFSVGDTNASRYAEQVLESNFDVDLVYVDSQILRLIDELSSFYATE